MGSLLLLPDTLVITGESACRGKVNKTPWFPYLKYCWHLMCLVPNGVGISIVKKVLDFEATGASEICLRYTFGPDCEAFN